MHWALFVANVLAARRAYALSAVARAYAPVSGVPAVDTANTRAREAAALARVFALSALARVAVPVLEVVALARDRLALGLRERPGLALVLRRLRGLVVARARRAVAAVAALAAVGRRRRARARALAVREAVDLERERALVRRGPLRVVFADRGRALALTFPSSSPSRRWPYRT